MSFPIKIDRAGACTQQLTGTNFGQKFQENQEKLGKSIIIDMFAFKMSTPMRENRTLSCCHKYLENDHTGFYFHTAITFKSSTYQSAALLLSKSVSILTSDDFLETSFMNAVSIWQVIPYSENRLRNRHHSSTIKCIMCFVPEGGCTCDLQRKIGRGLLQASIGCVEAVGCVREAEKCC